MNIVLDDISANKNLYPFTATRSAVDIRLGILTIRGRWEKIFGKNIPVASELAKDISENDLIKIDAAFIPGIEWINNFKKDGIIKDLQDSITIQQPWQIFQNNDFAIRLDFILITSNRVSAPVSGSNKIISPGNIFVEEGAKIEHTMLNASNGPIYIGKNTEIMEGSLLRGPVAICEGSTVKMGSRIYGATTIGPNCIVGGEIKNAVIFGNSNKAHDGYLGDSVIGEWCNLGAGTSNSNLKNSAGNINVWSNVANAFIFAGTKCGLLMGDYSRCAINTSFNTGTVVGVCCNIFSEGFPLKYIADFSWGNDIYKFDKAMTDIDNWKKLKGKSITLLEKKVLSDIYQKKLNA